MQRIDTYAGLESCALRSRGRTTVDAPEPCFLAWGLMAYRRTLYPGYCSTSTIHKDMDFHRYVDSVCSPLDKVDLLFMVEWNIFAEDT